MFLNKNYQASLDEELRKRKAKKLGKRKCRCSIQEKEVIF